MNYRRRARLRSYKLSTARSDLQKLAAAACVPDGVETGQGSKEPAKPLPAATAEVRSGKRHNYPDVAPERISPSPPMLQESKALGLGRIVHAHPFGLTPMKGEQAGTNAPS